MKLLRELFVIVLVGCSVATGQVPETLPPLKDARAPQSFDEMWAGFDPRAEPLEIQLPMARIKKETARQNSSNSHSGSDCK